MKKTRNIWMLLAAFVACIMITGCSESTEISEIVKKEEAKNNEEEKELSDEVSEMLKKLPGVSDVTIDIDKSDSKEEKVYFFIFEQQVDHKDPAMGTFNQRVTHPSCSIPTAMRWATAPVRSAT